MECPLLDQLDASGDEKRGSGHEQGIGPIAPDSPASYLMGEAAEEILKAVATQTAP